MGSNLDYGWGSWTGLDSNAIMDGAKPRLWTWPNLDYERGSTWFMDGDQAGSCIGPMAPGSCTGQMEPGSCKGSMCARAGGGQVGNSCRAASADDPSSPPWASSYSCRRASYSPSLAECTAVAQLRLWAPRLRPQPHRHRLHFRSHPLHQRPPSPRPPSLSPPCAGHP